MSELALRIPTLEWTWHTATGRTHGLGWVDDSIVDASRPYVVVDVGHTVRFRHVPYGGFVPPTMLEAAQKAEAEGKPTALHGLHVMFARAEWQIATREHMYGAVSSVPELLPDLVEAYGLDHELHRHQPETLAVLRAHAPVWYPRRGHLDRAIELYESAEISLPSLVDAKEATRDEVFACHEARWWRTHAPAAGALRITGGVATLTALDRPNTTREDIVLSLPAGQTFPHELLRLLPTWATVRLLSTVAT